MDLKEGLVFNKMSGDYDKFRPGYPEELVHTVHEYSGFVMTGSEFIKNSDEVKTECHDARRLRRFPLDYLFRFPARFCALFSLDYPPVQCYNLFKHIFVFQIPFSGFALFFRIDFTLSTSQA